MGVDGYIDPSATSSTHEHVGYINTARFVMVGIDERVRAGPELDEIERSSIDFYAQLRSLFRQHRDKELRGITSDTLAPDKDFYQDPNAPK